MSDQPVWLVAAAPAAIFSGLFGSFLLGQSLKCTGELDAILNGATGRGALLPMLGHALTHPVDLLPFLIPVFLGIWILLLANAQLRHRPRLGVIVGLFPIVASILGAVVMAPHLCVSGPSALSLSLISGGVFAAMAATIFVMMRRSP